MDPKQPETTLAHLLSDERLIEYAQLEIENRARYIAQVYADVAALPANLRYTPQQLVQEVQLRGRALYNEAQTNVPAMLKLDERLAVMPPEPTWVIQDLLRAGGVTIMAATPKCGKSTLSRWKSACVLSGAPFFGREVAQGPVLYYCFEDSDLLDIDMKAFGTYLNLGKHEQENMLVVTRHTQHENKYLKLDKLMTELKPSLVVLDTLNGFLEMGETTNDYGSVGEDMTTLKTVMAKNEWASKHSHILCTHHLSKGGTGYKPGQGGERDLFNGILGSTALRAGTDSNIVLHKYRGVVYWAGNEGRRTITLPEGQIILHGESMEFVPYDHNQVDEAEQAVMIQMDEVLTDAGPEGISSLDLGEALGVKKDKLTRLVKAAMRDGTVARVGGSPKGKLYSLYL